MVKKVSIVVAAKFIIYCLRSSSFCTAIVVRLQKKKIEIISMYSICLDMYALRLLAAAYGGTPEFPIRWGVGQVNSFIVLF